jgi:superoxide dismutase, Fe-Mn family
MYLLAELPYAYDALEPYIDARTMEIHYTKHYESYRENLNKALEAYPHLQEQPINELLTKINTLPDALKTAVRNHGGGYYNHTLFWPMMARKGGGVPKDTVAAEIKKHFNSFEQFQTQFNAAAKSVFGSGWAWLCLDKDGKMVVTTTANQDAPIMTGLEPLLGLDVWEHAYYLHYQNRRADYITAWWHVINWEQVEENYRQAR